MTHGEPFGLIGHGAVLDEARAFRGRALLLAGPARVGKRPLARVLAAAWNCRGPAGPCGACPSCLGVLHGAHPDVLEVEPKTTTSTGKTARKRLIPVSAISQKRDDARDHERHVLEWLETGPTYRRKVVIVDGAEFLNEESANALLKVVEEPPHGATFVFLTEDVTAVLPTIASRAVRLSTPPVAEAALARALERLEGEHPGGTVDGELHPGGTVDGELHPGGGVDGELHPGGTVDGELLAFAAGRPGVVLERAAARAALADARAFHGALQESMLRALEAAEALEKRFDPAWHVEALRFVLRDEGVEARSRADAALERALGALEQYVSPGLTFQWLALAWRAALGFA